VGDGRKERLLAYTYGKTIMSLLTIDNCKGAYVTCIAEA
jgi:hypothetical protein